MNLYSDADLLFGVIRDICRSKEGALRLLKTHVELALRELSLDSFAKFENDLYEHIFSLLDKESMDEKKGGIQSIRNLIDCPSANTDAKTTSFSQILSASLSSNKNFDVIVLMAHTMGYLIQYAPAPLVDFIESELSRALEWLQAPSPAHRKLAGCAVLEQLANNAPTLFYVKCKEFFDLIWGPLCDPKERLRIAAAQALSACMHELDKRTYHLQWYCSIYDHVLIGFKQGSLEHVHGSLLAVEELLKYTGDFMLPRYKEICVSVLSMRTHKSKVIRSGLVRLFPRLSGYSPEAYARHYLDITLDMLVTCTKQEDMKAVAISTVGKLCRSMGSYLGCRVDELVDVVREALLVDMENSKTDNKKVIPPEAFRCVADMVCGLGEDFHFRVLDLLDYMLMSGLTPELIDALAVIADNMPGHKEVIHQKLLGEILHVLSGEMEYVPASQIKNRHSFHKKSSITEASPNEFSWLKLWQFFTSVDPETLPDAGNTRLRIAPSFSRRACNRSNAFDSTARKNGEVLMKRKSFTTWFDHEVSSHPSTMPQKHSMSSFSSDEAALISNPCNVNPEKGVVTGLFNYDADLVLLAMRTLQLLSTPSSGVLLLVHRHVLPFLGASEEAVREEAACTAASLTAPIAKNHSLSLQGPSAVALDHVLTRLFEVCTTDPSPQVRAAILKSIKESFDRHLLHEQRLSSLQFLVNDECFDNRVAAIELLGSLADKNPAVILGNMRQIFINLISQLQHGTIDRLKEETTLLVCAFLRSPALHRVVKPFMSSLVDVLPINNNDVRLTMAGMEALGELCSVMKTNILVHVSKLLPLIIMNVVDGSSQRKQEISVRTLGQMVSASGLVVTPYLEYPQLLPAMLALVGKSSVVAWSLRREILSTLGLLGAADPTKYWHIESLLSALIEKNDEETSVDKLLAIRRSGVSELYLGEEAAQKTSVGIHYKITDLRASAVSLRRNDSSRGMLNAIDTLNDCKDLYESHSDGVHTEAVVRSAVGIHSIDADLPAHELLYELSVMHAMHFSCAVSGTTLSPNQDEYYPHTALTALMKILHDPTLHVHHPSVTQAITLIFQNLGIQCARYLDKVLPYFLKTVKKSGPGLRESVLDLLSHICVYAQYHISPFIKDLFDVITELWGDHVDHVLNLAESLTQHAHDSFMQYTPRLLKLLLSDLLLAPRDYESDSRAGMFAAVHDAKSTPLSEKLAFSHEDEALSKTLERKLQCLCRLRNVLRPHVDLVMSTLCKFVSRLLDHPAFSLIVTNHNFDSSNRIARIMSNCRLMSLAVRTMHVVSAENALIDFPHVAGRVVHTLVVSLREIYAVTESNPLLPYKTFLDLFVDCNSLFCAMATQLDSDFLILDRSIKECYSVCSVSNDDYDEIISAIMNGDEKALNIHPGAWNDDDILAHPDKLKMGAIVDDRDAFSLVQAAWGRSTEKTMSPYHTTKHSLNQQHLQKAWHSNQRYQTSDWTAWFKNVLIEMLRESPSPFLQACSPLAQVYFPLAKELFQPAFVSCWTELTEAHQDHIIRSMHTVFYSPTAPPEILLMLLNLAEFMEHDVEPLPIEPKVLAELAEKSHAYAKALHYRELEFQSEVRPSSLCFQRLIHINKKLNNLDGAYGILEVARSIEKTRPDAGIIVKEAWLAKLGRWNEALAIYERKLSAQPMNAEALVGRAKCLNALGRWEEALDILLCHSSIASKTQFNSSMRSVAHKAAVVGARAAWSLNRWDVMDTFVDRLPPNNVDATFMHAVLAVHNGNYAKSEEYIDKTRKTLNQNMAGLLAESYNRAYVDFVMNQQLSELEEIKEHKKLLSKAGLRLEESGDLYCGSRTSSDLSGKGHTSNESPHLANIPSFSSLSGIHNEEQDASSALSSSEKAAVAAEAANQKSFLIEKWKRRIRGCLCSGRAAITHWQNLLNVRKMLVGQREDVDTWLDFVKICRHGGNFALSRRSLGLSMDDDTQLGELPPHPSLSDAYSVSVDYRVELEKMRLAWSLGKKKFATKHLENIVHQLRDYTSSGGSAEQHIVRVHLECLLKLCDWKLRLLGPGAVINLKCRMEVLELYKEATNIDPQSYRAWHQWGLSSWHAVSAPESTAPSTPKLARASSFGQRPHRRASITASYDARTENFVLNALRGFFKAMSLASGKHCASVMQDMLCILNFWFKYGEHSNVSEAIRQGLEDVPLDCWLGVLPQLIARIHHVGDVGRALLHDLLSRLGAQHAQALMFPLSVALQSPRDDRQKAAQMLLMKLRQHSSQLIEQSVLVSQELIRIAILWDEEWHSTIEDASRLYYEDGNIQKMLDILLPLHEKMEAGPATNNESAFFQAYGNDLREAHNLLNCYTHYMNTNNIPIPTSGESQRRGKKKEKPATTEQSYLTNAWDIYTMIIRRIHPILKQITSHSMPNVSPQLVSAQNLDLAIPGTYTIRGEAVRIHSFRQQFGIILSKQRPRKIYLQGENGLEYVFLLKGHEDLRQDERAMQLFGLVNALLTHDRRTDSHDLSIQRYAVVPLSPNVGLSGWVPMSDTLHDLIRNYRERKKILLDIEHRLMEQLVHLKHDHEKLTSVQKLEVFEHALNNTNGKDLHRILWYQSTSSESWVIRREAYTKSLAVMSVVGYILGLGDRHPSNLMLQRDSCKILHIDFGDCFEVAMHRAKFPEKIPFRLTRMLVLAMEVSGVDGLFRRTCERVMKVMRENCDSIVAILEAFVHDPLLSWRLLNPNRDKASRGPEASMAPRQGTEAAKSEKNEASSSNNNSLHNHSSHVDKDPQQQMLPRKHSSSEDVPRGGVSFASKRLIAVSSSRNMSSSLLSRSLADSPLIEMKVSSDADDKEDIKAPVPPRQMITRKFIKKDGEDGQHASLTKMLFDAKGSERVDSKDSDDYGCVETLGSFSNIPLLCDTTLEDDTSKTMAFTSRSTRAATLSMVCVDGMPNAQEEELTDKAVTVVHRVLDKLTGLDFQQNKGDEDALEISEQIDKLIQMATSNDNLSSCFIGWCAFW